MPHPMLNSGLMYKSILGTARDPSPKTGATRRRAQSSSARLRNEKSQPSTLGSMRMGTGPAGTKSPVTRSRSMPGKSGSALSSSNHHTPTKTPSRYVSSPRAGASDSRLNLGGYSGGNSGSQSVPKLAPQLRKLSGTHASQVSRERASRPASRGGDEDAPGRRAPQTSQGEWKLHRTAQGKVYYWNTKTRETKWTLPSPLRQRRHRTKEEMDAIAQKVEAATPAEHTAASRIQGLVRMRWARLEVRRRRQAKLKQSISQPSNFPREGKRGVPSAAVNAASPHSNSKYSRTHSLGSRGHSHGAESGRPRTPLSRLGKRDGSVGGTPGRATRTSSLPGRKSATSSRAGSVRGSSPGPSGLHTEKEKERFRRSISHNTPSSHSSVGYPSSSYSRPTVRRSTSQGGRANSVLAKPSPRRRTPSAPAPSSRASSVGRKPRPSTPQRAAAKNPPQVPDTLDDPRYQEGGYLSIAQGHVMSERYELLLLLGTGQSATVWLAADTARIGSGAHQYVAIKITKCSESVRCSSLHEVALLYYISNRSPSRINGHETGSALLINHFEHEGRFGKHICMVFEVLGPTLDVLMAKTGFQGLGDIGLIKDITISILLGLDELAAMNVVHTDLKPENIMFSRPSVAVRKAVANYIDPRCDTSRITELPEDERSVKISDFGLSYLLRPKDDCHIDGTALQPADLQLIFASNYTKGAIIQTREYRAPEIILGNDFCTPTDIWSLACIVYELLTGQFLFDPKTLPHVKDETTMDAEHLAEMVHVMGAPPKAGVTNGVYCANYFDQETGVCRSDLEKAAKADITNTIKESVPRSCEGADREATLITHFVRAALTWDPLDRPTAADFLHHPWLHSRYMELHPGRKPACPTTREWEAPTEA
eukprot:TRINITY_DN17885_c0_g1_i1.p1 TRINITY_DN17885_c0_g1~~TRINITY_DN17885_c0_g1_i1.p1  ORF type:complete len:880 (+),score=191.04 TRINITY_DN17885_c0_g1_i1:97-2736(+)